MLKWVLSVRLCDFVAVALCSFELDGIGGWADIEEFDVICSVGVQVSIQLYGRKNVFHRNFKVKNVEPCILDPQTCHIIFLTLSFYVNTIICISFDIVTTLELLWKKLGQYDLICLFFLQILNFGQFHMDRPRNCRDISRKQRQTFLLMVTKVMANESYLPSTSKPMCLL